jgi:hypothetical protein
MNDVAVVARATNVSYLSSGGPAQAADGLGAAYLTTVTVARPMVTPPVFYTV